MRGGFNRLTEDDIRDIRDAHRLRQDALRKVKYLQSKLDLTTQRFSQVARGKVDGRRPAPNVRAKA